MGSGLRAVLGVVVVAGIGVGAWALLRLKTTKEVVERTLTPITVSAPDLFPADTRLFVAMHGMDGDYAAFDAWRRRVEPTVLWTSLSRLWGPEGPAGRQVQRARAQFDASMDEVEGRFGYRPTTEDFFRVYGRFTAFGLVPAEGGGEPGLLGVVKLPDEGAAALLEGHLGKHGKVKRRDGLVRGYPVFEEDMAGGKSMLYGVGGNHLFIANRMPALEAALGRMEFLQAKSRGEEPPAAPGASLATVAEFRAAAGADWSTVRAALFMRRDVEFRLLDPGLEAMDRFTRGAFILTPGSDAMAVAMLRRADGGLELASSVPGARGEVRDWERRVPAGITAATLIRHVPAAERGPAEAEAFRRFKEKAIWKEAAALLRDPARMETLVLEAAGPDALPGDDTLARLKHDVDLIEAVFDSVAAESVSISTPAAAMISKSYGSGEDESLQQAYGGEVDLTTRLLLATGCEAAREELERQNRGHFLVHETRGDAHLWLFDLPGVVRELQGARAPNAAMEFWSGMSPALVQADGCLWLVLGHDLAREIADCAGGKAPNLGTDALWKECVAELPPSPRTVIYQRPADAARAQWNASRELFLSAAADMPMDRDGRDVVRAFVGGIDRAMRWPGNQRAAAWATYADSAEEARGILLVEGSAKPGAPNLVGDPFTPAAMDALPESCIFVGAGSLGARPLFDDFLDGALTAITDGKRRWEDLRAELRRQDKGRPGVFVDSLEILVREVRGETGFALCAPTGAATEPSPPELQAVLDRLPVLCVFATYEDGGRAFDAAAAELELIRDLADEHAGAPFEMRLREWRSFRGSMPVGVSFFRDREHEVPLAVLRLQIPSDRRGPVSTVEFGVLRRGDTLYWCSGGALIAHLRGVKGASMGARLRADMGGASMPGSVVSYGAWRSDGVADLLRPYWNFLAVIGPSVSLQGLGPDATPDRVAAHERGWLRVIELLDDALRPGTWHVSWVTREGDRLPSGTRRFPVAPR